jgi:chromosome segregation ATPase
MSKEAKEIENNWIGWLQARIPATKKGANEFWLRQALNGYSNEQTQSLKQEIKELKHEIKVVEFQKQILGEGIGKANKVIAELNEVIRKQKEVIESCQIG